MEFKELLDHCKAQAIAGALEPNEETVWRSICRTYSKTFHTPLHLVFEIDPEQIMLAVFEEQLEDFDEAEDLDKVLDKIYALEDPNYEAEKNKEVKDFIKQAEEEEEERLRLGKPIHPSLKGESTLKTLPEDAESGTLPKSGGINLSYLEREETGLKNF